MADLLKKKVLAIVNALFVFGNQFGGGGLYVEYCTMIFRFSCLSLRFNSARYCFAHLKGFEGLRDATAVKDAALRNRRDSIGLTADE